MWNKANMTDPIASPSMIRLLPKNLFESPVITLKSSPKIPLDEENLDDFGTVSAELHMPRPETQLLVNGLQLKTQSGVTIVIEDGQVVENLLLMPMMNTFLKVLHQWTENPSERHLIQLVHIRSMMFKLFEEYMRLFDPQNIDSTTDFDYLCLSYILKKQDKIVDKLELIGGLQELQKITQTWASKSDFKLKRTESLDQMFNKLQKTCLTSTSQGQANHLHVLGLKQDTVNGPAENVPIKSLTGSGQSGVGTSHESKNSLPFPKPASIPILPPFSLDTDPTYKSKLAEEAKFNIRYKTQPCRHYIQSKGSCPVGSKCHFAHGPSELRDPKLHPKFRTKICRNFWETGQCEFGQSCFFKHVRAGSKDTSSSTDKQTMAQSEQSRDLPEGSLARPCSDSVLFNFFGSEPSYTASTSHSNGFDDLEKISPPTNKPVHLDDPNSDIQLEQFWSPGDGQSPQSIDLDASTDSIRDSIRTLHSLMLKDCKSIH